MFVAKDRASGLYHKRGAQSSAWGCTLVELEKATLYRTKSGLIQSVGRWTPIPGGPKVVGRRKVYGENILDVDKWEVVEISPITVK